MLHSPAVTLQNTRLISIHHHQCLAGAAAGIEAGTPKRGLEECEKGKGGTWESASKYLGTEVCIPA